MRVRTWLGLIALLGVLLAVVGRLAFLLGTEYTPDFDERRFQAVYPKMLRGDVERMLGMPFRVTAHINIVGRDGRVHENVTRYEYSRSPIDHDYEIRAVIFDAQDRVVDRWDMHWSD